LVAMRTVLKARTNSSSGEAGQKIGKETIGKLKYLRISISACAECSMLCGKALLNKPINHSFCKDHPDFFCHLPLDL
jgi:hypothetical protein